MMSKELRELLNQLDLKNKKMGELLNKEGVTKEELENISNEIDVLQAKVEAQKKKDAIDDSFVDGKGSKVPGAGEGTEMSYKDAFLNAVRGNMTKEVKAALSSNVDEDGRLLIPQDILTRINELRRNYRDMYDYVNVETVGTLTGSRVIEKEADITPLEGVAELVTIPDMGSPQFAQVEYSINDYKGLLEIPNSLIKDENADLEGYLVKWIAKKLVATHNSLIFYADGTKVQGILGTTVGGFTSETLTAPAVVKDFKSVFNKKLPSAIATTAKIFTNQSGFDYLDGLEDNFGRPLLQPDVTDSTKYKFLGRDVVVFDDAVLKNKDTTGEVPFIIGDAKEAYTYFDRENMSIATSTEAGFENDSTKMRVIARGDGKFVDTKALYILYSPVEAPQA